ncbi:MAG: IPT/TIG domain-containing protein [Ignavibacteriales bacterium]|nr:IPT/TIG domain-containing protein [Ignavibacteriales bacterium]
MILKYNTSYYLTVLSFILLAGCSVDEPPEVWNPAAPTGPDPVITAVSPAAGGFAEVTEVHIMGKNFSDTDSLNAVYFDNVRATILSASTTELVVKAPKLVSNNISVKVAVAGGVLLAKYGPYKLSSLFVEYGGILSVDEVYSFAFDAGENLYAQFRETGTSVKIFKIDSNATKTEYATAGVAKFADIKMGPGGFLYCQRTSSTELYRVPAGGGSIAVFHTLANGFRGRFFDFDSLGNMYFGGGTQAGMAVYSPSTSSSRVLVPSLSAFEIRSVRAFNGYVYFLGYRSTLRRSAIYRLPITSATGDLGALDTVFTISAATVPGWIDTTSQPNQALAIAIAEDGDIYLGSDQKNPVHVIRQGVATALYPGVLEAPAGQLMWGNGEFLYINRYATNSTSPAVTAEKRRIIKLFVGKKGAPDFGRQ